MRALRASWKRGLSFASLSLVVASFVACSEDIPDEETASGTGGASGSSSSGTGGDHIGGASGTASGGASGAATAGASTGGAAGTDTGGVSGTATGGVSGTATGGLSGSATGGVSGSATGGSAGSVPGDRGTAEGTCARWNADRADLSEGTWSGSVESCDAGDISPNGRANALKLINLYRWLADLPAVVTEASRDSMAQQCALMQQAHGSLSHEPTSDWQCYTEEGAEGSGSSNISGGPGVVSIDRYMLDQGNATTIGHRRWTLSNSLGPIGLGSTGTGASCFQNLTGTGRAGKPWMAWPSPGIIPLQAFGSGRATIDSTGWSIQSDSINLASAVVTVTSAGMDLPVTVTQLGSGYGSRYAIHFNPMGWTTAAGQTYSVSVSGVATPIMYDVVVVSCAT